jgi:hypothetical protein
MTPKSNKEITLKLRFHETTCPTTWPEKALLGARTEVEANTRHGIHHVPGKGRDLFHSLDEIVPAFEGSGSQGGHSDWKREGSWAVNGRCFARELRTATHMGGHSVLALFCALNVDRQAHKQQSTANAVAGLNQTTRGLLILVVRVTAEERNRTLRQRK